MAKKPAKSNAVETEAAPSVAATTSEQPEVKAEKKYTGEVPETLTQEQMEITIQALAKDRGIIIDLEKPWYDETNSGAFKSLTQFIHGLVYSLVPSYSIQPEATQNFLRSRFASM